MPRTKIIQRPVKIQFVIEKEIIDSLRKYAQKHRVTMTSMLIDWIKKLKGNKNGRK